MDTLGIKYATTEKALQSLHQAIIFFDKAKQISDLPLLGTHSEIYQAARDSVIQRFEFSVELFWKYIRVFLETDKQIKLESIAPCDVVRSACQFRLLNENDTKHCLDMIKSRNLTSHIYKEDIAEQLARDIPAHYGLMKKILDALRPV